MVLLVLCISEMTDCEGNVSLIDAVCEQWPQKVLDDFTFCTFYSVALSLNK